MVMARGGVRGRRRTERCQFVKNRVGQVTAKKPRFFKVSLVYSSLRMGSEISG
jgi:hypothetical protein